MLKRYTILLVATGVLTLALESCFLIKNKCDSCPGLVKNKKVRRSSKGSI